MPNSVRPHRWKLTRLPRPWDSPGKNTGVGCHFLLQCIKVKSESEVAQSCPTLRDPTDCSLPGSSIHGIYQARVLEWGAIAFSNMYLPVISKDFPVSTESKPPTPLTLERMAFTSTHQMSTPFTILIIQCLSVFHMLVVQSRVGCACNMIESLRGQTPTKLLRIILQILLTQKITRATGYASLFRL